MRCWLEVCNCCVLVRICLPATSGARSIHQGHGDLQATKQRPPRPRPPPASPLISTMSTPFGTLSKPAGFGTTQPPWQGSPSSMQSKQAPSPYAEHPAFSSRLAPPVSPDQTIRNQHAAPAGFSLENAGAKQGSAHLAGPSSSEIELQDVNALHVAEDICINIGDEGPLCSSETADEAGDAASRCVDFSEHAPLLHS